MDRVIQCLVLKKLQFTNLCDIRKNYLLQFLWLQSSKMLIMLRHWLVNICTIAILCLRYSIYILQSCMRGREGRPAGSIQVNTSKDSMLFEY